MCKIEDKKVWTEAGIYSRRRIIIIRESVQQGNYEDHLVKSCSRLNMLTGVKIIEIINQWELLVPFWEFFSLADHSRQVKN